MQSSNGVDENLFGIVYDCPSSGNTVEVIWNNLIESLTLAKASVRIRL